MTRPRPRGPRTPERIRPAGYLCKQRNPDRVWAYTEGVALSDVDSTAYCIEVLHRGGAVRHLPSILAGESYLSSGAVCALDHYGVPALASLYALPALSSAAPELSRSPRPAQ